MGNVTRKILTEVEDENAFEALCLLASKERWCWKNGCTTCGCMHFRCAFRLLTEGEHPHSENWHVTKRRPPRMDGPLSWSIEMDEQRKLARIMAGASVNRVAEICRFPDWLGYLGLALYACSDVEAADRRLTDAWVPVLRELVSADPGAASHFGFMEHDKSDRLKLQDLELVKKQLNH